MTKHQSSVSFMQGAILGLGGGGAGWDNTSGMLPALGSCRWSYRSPECLTIQARWTMGQSEFLG